MATVTPTNQPDVLVGTGIMSATLAVILKELDPKLKIEIHEVLGSGLKNMIPSYGQSLIDNPALTERVRAETPAVLHINNNIIITKNKKSADKSAA
jgi:Malate:quinone oxidoreductase (Mqo)